jgi:hypothetical protein
MPYKLLYFKFVMDMEQVYVSHIHVYVSHIQESYVPVSHVTYSSNE